MPYQWTAIPPTYQAVRQTITRQKKIFEAYFAVRAACHEVSHPRLPRRRARDSRGNERVPLIGEGEHVLLPELDTTLCIHVALTRLIRPAEKQTGQERLPW